MKMFENEFKNITVLKLSNYNLSLCDTLSIYFREYNAFSFIYISALYIARISHEHNRKSYVRSVGFSLVLAVFQPHIVSFPSL